MNLPSHIRDLLQTNYFVSADELDKPLDNIYLMGYELQRNSFFDKTKTENSKTEE